ncbi:MAG: winged helix-turn-helix transcriptional regulator [Culicoidibacterales bacterium]
MNRITDFMLTKSLKGLAQYGIVERIQYNEVPARVE